MYKADFSQRSELLFVLTHLGVTLPTTQLLVKSHFSRLPCRIMGLYASVVLVIGKFVREFFSGISHTIMFEELPNVDRILKLCTDIFLVRETGELDLEEDMYEIGRAHV